MGASSVQRGKTYEPDAFDFRLKAGASAIDAGVRLPNINIDQAGAAPDLGAIEYDEDRPRYGPRLKVGQ